jgi:tetratricopeptide (TPR) repeat protein
MSRHLNLAEHLLSLGQRYLSLGRHQEALRAFGGVVRLDPVPGELAQQAQAELANIHFRRNQFRRARRHLHAALAHDPSCARYHHQMAISLEDEDVQRALGHYARAVELEPNSAEFHCDFGLCLLSLAEVQQGLQHLQRAVHLDPDEPGFLRQLMRALVDADQLDAARSAVLAALFGHPQDQRFKGLWQEFRFCSAERLQHRGAVARRFGSTGPIVLSFKQQAKAKVRSRRALEEDGTILRIDGPHLEPQPHFSERSKRRQRP